MIDITKKAAGHLHIVCTSEFGHLDRIVDETQAFIGALVDDDEFAYKVVLLVSEAVTNAIEHGNTMDTTKKVRLDVVVGEKRVAISVEDEGAGFDPSAVKNPTDEANLLMDGGRGIFFIEQMADEVQYAKDGRQVHIFFDR